MSAAAPPAALTDPLLRASLFEDAAGALPPSAFRAAPPRAERIHRGQNRQIEDPRIKSRVFVRECRVRMPPPAALVKKLPSAAVMD